MAWDAKRQLMWVTAATKVAALVDTPGCAPSATNASASLLSGCKREVVTIRESGAFFVFVVFAVLHSQTRGSER